MLISMRGAWLIFGASDFEGEGCAQQRALCALIGTSSTRSKYLHYALDSITQDGPTMWCTSNFLDLLTYWRVYLQLEAVTV